MPSTRDESFVPLIPQSGTAPAGQRAEFRVAILSQAGNARPLHPSGQPAAAPSPDTRCAAGETRVSVQREGDRVASIQIQCACGQLIQLACVYEAPPGQS